LSVGSASFARMSGPATMPWKPPTMRWMRKSSAAVCLLTHRSRERRCASVVVDAAALGRPGGFGCANPGRPLFLGLSR
jgi:hypothetical protein